MHILLNGERRDLPGPRTVRILLEDLGIDARVVAVEVNRTVIRRERHDHTIVSDGAEVEIVSFVGGGALSAATRWRRAGAENRPRESVSPLARETDSRGRFSRGRFSF